MVRAPWLSIFPGLALTLAVFAFNVLGHALRNLLDPRRRE
jgi:peptide/nickel transport system permease protein